MPKIELLFLEPRCYEPTPKILGMHERRFEDKCRNVLVRYCSYIPRNYQYRDGIPLVFLILRDFFGDEHLGRVAGVLYEMIEIDCWHTDDHGAAFQRWKHAHMTRHDDLELPHIPHLTTIASAVTPTSTLVEWRKHHSERYSTRLSDHAHRPVSDHRCVSTRKDWSIDYTMYVSSRDGGTHPFRTIEPKVFHEILWGLSDFGSKGRLVEERSIDSHDSSLRSDTGSGRQDSGRSESELAINDHSDTSSSRIRALCRKISSWKVMTTASEQESVPAPNLAVDTTFKQVDHVPEISVSHRKIPNAMFARKFRIFKSSNLPISIRERPIAEDKAVNMAVDRSSKDLRKFSGPFTPQLWFDSGLDFNWKKA